MPQPKSDPKTDALREQGSQVEVSSILTQVVVDPEDPAFASPSKPVGPYYSEEFAQVLQGQRGWHMEPSETQGWRRVVPSPKPIHIFELRQITGIDDTETIETLASLGFHQEISLSGPVAAGLLQVHMLPCLESQ